MKIRQMPTVYFLICFIPMWYALFVVPRIMQPPPFLPRSRMEVERSYAESLHRGHVASYSAMAVALMSITIAGFVACLSVKKGDETILKKRLLSVPLKGIIILGILTALLRWRLLHFRICFPLRTLDNAEPSGIGGHQ